MLTVGAFKFIDLLELILQCLSNCGPSCFGRKRTTCPGAKKTKSAGDAKSRGGRHFKAGGAIDRISVFVSGRNSKEHGRSTN